MNDLSVDRLRALERIALDAPEKQPVARHAFHACRQIEPSHDAAVCPRLLADLAYRSFLKRLAGLHATARQDPEHTVGVAVLHQQDPVAPRDDDAHARWLDRALGGDICMPRSTLCAGHLN